MVQKLLQLGPVTRLLRRVSEDFKARVADDLVVPNSKFQTYDDVIVDSASRIISALVGRSANLLGRAVAETLDNGVTSSNMIAEFQIGLTRRTGPSLNLMSAKTKMRGPIDQDACASVFS